MKFGICTGVEGSDAARAAGWDYVEANVQSLLQGLVPDEQWQGERQAKGAALPILAANVLLPGTLKVSGPEADLGKLRPYIRTVTQRAAKVGMKKLVFGSGGARNVPEGFDRERARKQITDFARVAAEAAGEAGITLVVEPLNRGECNIINTIGEAMEYVRAVDHPNFKCLLDTYHLWLESEPLENLRQAMPWIKHVHVADVSGRVAPGESGRADYKPVFRVLKDGGYDDAISVEALNFDIPSGGERVLKYLRDQWKSA